MTAPSPPAEGKPATLTYIEAHRAAFKGWQNRGKWVAFPAAAVVFAAILFAISRAAPDHPFLGFFAAMAAAFVTLMLMIGVVLPTLPLPTVPCPYCAGPVPLLDSPKPFKPFVRVVVCPHCKRELPH